MHLSHFLFLREIGEYLGMSLIDLPFPLDQLTWDKLPQVQKALGLSKIEAHTIMQHVLGPPDPGLIIKPIGLENQKHVCN